jgi:hypothetical protein
MGKRRSRLDLRHQVFYATRELIRGGVDPEVVDLHSLIDTTLTYSENRHLVVLPLIHGTTLKHVRG